MKPEINGRGHWLASAMLNGPGRKEPKPGHTSIFGSGRKRRAERSKRLHSNDDQTLNLMKIQVLCSSLYPGMAGNKKWEN